MPSPADFNRAVRDFAALHRLRTAVREDGEVVIPVGPRRSDSHASLGNLTTRNWTFYASGSGQAVSILRAAGAPKTFRMDDGMLVAPCAESEFFAVGDSTRWTTPRRIPRAGGRPWTSKTRPRREE